MSGNSEVIIYVCEFDCFRADFAFFSNPQTNEPKAVKNGNPSSVSALVMVDDKLELDEDSFKFLLEILKGDLFPAKLPSKVLCYRDWYLQNGIPISEFAKGFEGWGKVANMDKLSEIYNKMQQFV